ncbi:outer membrane protein transport protein [Balneolales bacterium ANBcel1]|nr:outer membrane protein transport protein [Balneolales bacterium ANBcel1]
MAIRFSISPVLLACLFLLTGAPAVQAQYSFDALRLSQQVPGQDPHSIALGSSSAARLQGLGSYLVNPAVAGKIEKSFFTAGLGIRDVSQESTYLGQTTSFDDNQIGLTNIGFAYRVPTAVGSLVIGGGYTQTADFNSAYSIDAFNDMTSRTYQSLTDYTNDIAYNTFAIDDPHGQLQSVFDYGGFEGVFQYAETTHRGQSGEYSLFLATEFQQDLFLGVTAGVPVSNYRFNQVFIEEAPWDINRQPLYTGEANTGTYNIDQLLFEERLRVNAVGWNFRAGLLYTGLSFVDVGASYALGTRWKVEERFDTYYQTEFLDVVTFDGVVQTDNGDTFGPVVSSEIEGEYSYSVTSPARINLGAATKNLPFVDVSFSAERINYSSIQLDDFDAQDRRTEISENNFINENFEDVWNFRAGVAFTTFGAFEPRLGWAYMSNPIGYLEDNDRQFLSAGLGIGLQQNMSIDIAVQYGLWNTTEDVYYVDESTGIIVDDATGSPVTFFETADQDVTRLHATVGLNIRF